MWRRRSAGLGALRGRPRSFETYARGQRRRAEWQLTARLRPQDRRSWQGRNRRGVLCTRAGEDAARGDETRPESLPLDGAGGLRGDVQDDAVDLTQLVDHARGDGLEQVIWQAGPVGGPRVGAGAGAEPDDLARCARVPLPAAAAHLGQPPEA